MSYNNNLDLLRLVGYILNPHSLSQTHSKHFWHIFTNIFDHNIELSFCIKCLGIHLDFWSSMFCTCFSLCKKYFKKWKKIPRKFSTKKPSQIFKPQVVGNNTQPLHELTNMVRWGIKNPMEKRLLSTYHPSLMTCWLARGALECGIMWPITHQHTIHSKSVITVQLWINHNKLTKVPPW